MKLYFATMAAAMLASTQANATTFVEVEPNDSTASAQVLVHNGSIALTGFREAISVNTFTDFFRFSAAAGDSIVYRVNTIGGGDPLIRLLDSVGNVLAQDDDSGGGFNSLINFNITQTGNYFAALRGFGNSQYNYELTITGLTGSPGVPEPAAWAFMIAGFGLAGAAMRRRSVRVNYAA